MKTQEVKFYWNGIKINGELIKCYYWHTETDAIRIIAKDYNHLPSDLFTVTNGSDLYTDYFEDDEAIVEPEHPLYKFVKYAMYKCEEHDLKHAIKYYGSRKGWEEEAKKQQKLLDELQPVRNPGHPAAADLAAVEAMNNAAESARLEEEHQQQLAQREAFLNARCNGRHYVEEVMADHPIIEGQPVVTIEWSECAAFASWEDGKLKMSVAAAEIVLRHYDEENAANENKGYDKTSFRIDCIYNGEEETYTGRYDLGDNDGGLIAHIRSYGEYYKEQDVVELSEWLDTFTAGKVISVTVAPWFEEAMRQKKQQEEAAKQEEVNDVMQLVEMLTDDQIEDAAMIADDKTVARFFLQELAKRDEKRAVAAMKRWNAERGAAG